MSGSQMAMRAHIRAFRLAGFTLARWTLVGATVALVMLLTVGASQACEPDENNLIPPVAQTVTQIAEQAPATMSAVVEFTVLNTSGKSGGLALGDDLCCSCHCCPASPAAICVESYVPAVGGNLRQIAVPFARTHLPSTEPDAPRRPPRLFV